MRRQLLTATVSALASALLGAPLGLLWQAICPSVQYVVAAGKPVLADPETQALISSDGGFAVLATLFGVVVFWPIAAAGVFGLLEAVDLAGRHRIAEPLVLTLGDGGGTRGGQPYQVGGGQFDLQAAPTGRDEDRTEP